MVKIGAAAATILNQLKYRPPMIKRSIFVWSVSPTIFDDGPFDDDRKGEITPAPSHKRDVECELKVMANRL